MVWKKMLAYVTGTVEEELLLRSEYLAAENRILRAQIEGRVQLTESDRRTLAEIGKKLGKKALEEIATIVKPETILGWYRRLVAKKFDSSKSKKRKGPGRPRVDGEIEKLVIQFAKENRDWGYDRIVGALENLGHKISDETVGNILRRNGILPAPERSRQTTWKEFVSSHSEVLTATDFFTAEVWTRRGLVTYYVLVFFEIATRRVKIAGMTPNPNEAWMMQMARNVSIEDGFLKRGCYMLHDRDTKYTDAFLQALKDIGVEPVKLPAKSPNLNAHCER